MVGALLSMVFLALFCGPLVRVAVAEEVKFEGAIVKVEGENVTVREAANERMVKMEPGTKIVSGGKPVNVDDLKVGQKVRCVCDRRDGQMVCTAMEISRDTP